MGFMVRYVLSNKQPDIHCWSAFATSRKIKSTARLLSTSLALTRNFFYLPPFCDSLQRPSASDLVFFLFAIWILNNVIKHFLPHSLASNCHCCVLFTWMWAECKLKLLRTMIKMIVMSWGSIKCYVRKKTFLIALTL